MAWYDRKENSTGALCARLSGDASKVRTFNNFFYKFENFIDIFKF